ncbi:nucleolar complex protein 4 homolog [Limulus polyphemus]|uniref:Nucleolar complex protein 4 homolog n=1 Tax=Limulus polyphemus TaxID=6850 RepID=A0ABM1BIV6_LIMPO|nr:nucleolar complex protein 4 homolog [Limulus polyphemus]
MASSRKKVVNEIKDKANAFLASRKNCNFLIELHSTLMSSDVYEVLAGIQAINRVFHHLLQNGDLYQPSSHYDEELTIEDKYKAWLHDQYVEIKSRLLELLQHDNQNVQELALCTLMRLVSGIGKDPLHPVDENIAYFPTELLQDVLRQLLSEEKDLRPLIGRFQEFLEYNDVKFYTLKILTKLMKLRKKKDLNDCFLHNLFALMSQIVLPKKPSKKFEAETKLENNLIQSENRPSFVLHYITTSKKFSFLWLEFLKCKLPVGLYKKVLLMLHEHVLAHLQNPLLLTDFLIDSYNVGGAISLLALNSLFVLIQKYNLEYPDFYGKLYALLEPEVFHVKYKARFFYLADIFLSSTHLPAYLVAAFIKRLARLALSAPPHALLMVIPFIGNLLLRHPNLKILLNRENISCDVTSDPYIMEERDLTKCRAIESSLWEVKTLQNHWCPDVASKAKFINGPLPKMEFDLSDLMIEKEVKRKIKDVPVAFDRPSGLFQRKEDKMEDIWILE